MIKKASLLLTLCTLLIFSILSPLQIEAATTESSATTSLFKVVTDSAVVMSEDGNEAGLLFKGAQFSGMDDNDDFVSFFIGEHSFTINKTALEKAEGDISLNAPEVTDESSIRYVKANNAIELFSINAEERAAAFPKDSVFPLVSEESDYYLVAIGSVSYKITKDSSVTISEENPQLDGTEESVTEPAIEEEQGTVTEPDIEEEQRTVTTPAVESVPDGSETHVEQIEEKGTTQTDKHSDVTVSKFQAANETPSFTAATKYFKPNIDQLIVYDNSTGSLVPMGYLVKNQTYERDSSLGANWHKIKFGSKFGYVHLPSTVPGNKTELPNPVKESETERMITMKTNAVVQDNSSGALVPMGVINSGISYPITGKMGNWYKVNFSGRAGFIHSNQATEAFSSSDKFFLTIKDTPVYDNSTGSLVQIAELPKNQVFSRLGDLGANWHKIQLGNKPYYVAKINTVPDTGATIKNKNTAVTTSTAFETISAVDVFDNSSGALVKFGTLSKGVKVNITGTMGNWHKIDFGGRIGFVHQSNTKIPFKTTDQYFEVYEDDVWIYNNPSGALQPVARLQKGQTYQRIKESGDWHEVKYGNGIAYVLAQPTKPSTSTAAKNFNTANLKNSDKDFITREDTAVFDNTSGKMVQFATILKDERYPIIDESGSYWRISLGNRIGYVEKSSVIVGPIFKTTQYTKTVQEVLNIQMTKSPQTDLYRNDKAYVHKDYVTVPSPITIYPATGVVNTSSLNIRDGAGTDYRIVGSLKQNTTVKINSLQGNWYEVTYGPWKNAKDTDVIQYLDPNKFSQISSEYFQFLVLSQNAGISATEMNQKILSTKGILKDKGASFVQASQLYNINELYLISHALLETGNGTSNLSTGVLVSSVDGIPVTPKMVYNMFGIGALDACPLKCGSETAYKNSWFTPEAAITGGAKFISEMYVNHPIYKQDTLYKMRWNPQNPGTHQYATDIGWSVKQVNNIKKLYDLIDAYTLYFDFPVYK